MPQVQRLKKKFIDKGSKVGMDPSEDGSLYLKFEENPTLSKFIENSESVLDNKSDHDGNTIIKDKERFSEEIPNENKNEKSSYSKLILTDEKNFEKIDSGSFKRNIDDNPCYSCKMESGKCLIQ